MIRGIFLPETIFFDLISSYYNNRLLMLTEGSNSFNSAGFSYYILSLNIYFSFCHQPPKSSFIAEFYAVHALHFIFFY